LLSHAESGTLAPLTRNAKIRAVPVPLRITPNQAHAFRLERHHLTRTAPSTLLNVASDICGVPAQIMGSAHLSLNARLPQLTCEEIRDALHEKRSLVKAHCMRQTIHLSASTQYATFISAIKKSRIAHVRRIMSRSKSRRSNLTSCSASSLMP
jgi:Winged helix DNA-binding domain